MSQLIKTGFLYQSNSTDLSITDMKMKYVRLITREWIDIWLKQTELKIFKIIIFI